MFAFLSEFLRPAKNPRDATSYTPTLPARAGDATPVNFLPDLVTDLKREHRLLEASFAALVQAHGSGDVAACIDSLRIFNNALRAHLLKENLWLYRYLDQALRRDRTAAARMAALRTEMQAIGRELNAFSAEYVGSSWDERRRRRLGGDLLRIGAMLDHRIAVEESRLYPLYRSAGQP